jgi:butyryl-CoA dehydrogenase
MWLRQALAATEGERGATGDERDFYDGKLAACRYFFRWELPKTEAQATLLQSLEDTCLRVRSALF